jgi:hypothetical protein
MSELALFIVRAGLLLVLWLFILSIIAIIRADLFSERVLSRVVEKNLPESVSSPTTGLTSVGNFSTAPGSATIVSAISETPITLVVIDGPLQGLELVLDRKEKGVRIEVHPYLHAYFTKGLFSRQWKWFMKYKQWIPVNSRTDNQLLEYRFKNKDNQEITF